MHLVEGHSCLDSNSQDGLGVASDVGGSSTTLWNTLQQFEVGSTVVDISDIPLAIQLLQGRHDGHIGLETWVTTLEGIAAMAVSDDENIAFRTTADEFLYLVSLATYRNLLLVGRLRSGSRLRTHTRSYGCLLRGTHTRGNSRFLRSNGSFLRSYRCLLRSNGCLLWRYCRLLRGNGGFLWSHSSLLWLFDRILYVILFVHN